MSAMLVACSSIKERVRNPRAVQLITPTLNILNNDNNVSLNLESYGWVLSGRISQFQKDK